MVELRQFVELRQPGINVKETTRSFRESCDELNERFRQAGAKLDYHNGFIQISPDELTKDQIERPFWNLVSAPEWENVDQDMKEAIDQRDAGGRDPAWYAARALESTIKIISDERGWTTSKEKGAKNYLDKLRSQKNGGFEFRAQLMGMHERKIRRAITDLVAERWIQVVRLNGPGTVAAYVVNDRVAWGQPRDQLQLSTFSAQVVANIADQDTAALDHHELRRIPVLLTGERQLPTGAGEDPPSQPTLPEFEPDLPALERDSSPRESLAGPPLD